MSSSADTWSRSDNRLDALFDKSLRLLDRIKASAGGHRAELYLRETRRRRLTFERRGGRSTLGEGVECGVALRLLSDDGKREGFAAASLSGADIENWLVTSARSSLGVPAHAPVGMGGPAEVDDVTGGGAIADVDAMAGWIDKAFSCLGLSSAGVDSKVSGWLEVATTSEILVNGSPLRARRQRDRVWAVAQVGHAGPGGRLDSLLEVTGRRLEDLDAAAWARYAIVAVQDPPHRPEPLEVPLVLDRGPSSRLVAFLVAVLHGGSASAFDVGAGWRVDDAPRHPDAFVGGTFDDAGFPTQRRTLADGRHGVPLQGPGTYRRESYRDRPRSLPSCLILAETSGAAPKDAFSVRDLRITGMPGGECLVELEGRRLRGGELDSQFLRARIRTNARELVRACVGSVGEPQHESWAVITPALVLEGLPVVT